MNYFNISCLIGSEDYTNLKRCIDQGIDSRLEGFTQSHFSIRGDRLECNVHLSELQILVRRLLEMEIESSELLADDIIQIHYGIELI